MIMPTTGFEEAGVAIGGGDDVVQKPPLTATQGLQGPGQVVDDRLDPTHVRSIDAAG